MALLDFELQHLFNRLGILRGSLLNGQIVKFTTGPSIFFPPVSPKHSTQWTIPIHFDHRRSTWGFSLLLFYSHSHPVTLNSQLLILNYNINIHGQGKESNMTIPHFIVHSGWVKVFSLLSFTLTLNSWPQTKIHQNENKNNQFLTTEFIFLDKISSVL